MKLNIIPMFNSPYLFKDKKKYKYIPYVSGMGGDFPDTGPAIPLTNLALWLKADAIVGLNDNDPVTTWEDSSSENNDATQGTAANKPLYKTGIINGLPVVRFDASNDFMDTPDNAFVANPFSIFMVFSGTIAAGTHRAINDNGGANFGIGTDTADIIVFNGAFIGAAGLVNDDPILVTYIHDGANASFWVDTVLAGTNAQANTPGRIRLSAPAGDVLNGDIAEVIAYTADMTAQRVAIETYLNTKYNL
jgi:hypothetical protein